MGVDTLGRGSSRRHTGGENSSLRQELIVKIYGRRKKEMGKERCAGATPKACGVWRVRMDQLARDLEPSVLGPNCCCLHSDPSSSERVDERAVAITLPRRLKALDFMKQVELCLAHGEHPINTDWLFSACRTIHHEGPWPEGVPRTSQTQETKLAFTSWANSWDSERSKNLCAHRHGVLSGKFHSKELWFMHKIVFKFCRVTSDQHVKVYDTYMYFTFGLVPFLKCFIMDMQICQNRNYGNSKTF